jgi:hypothetical protein
VWEAERRAGRGARYPDGIGRVSLQLGDDLEAGRHRVRVRLLESSDAEGTAPRPAEARGRVLVRAIVVGQARFERDDDVRLWTAEPF